MKWGKFWHYLTVLQDYSLDRKRKETEVEEENKEVFKWIKLFLHQTCCIRCIDIMLSQMKTFLNQCVPHLFWPSDSYLSSGPLGCELVKRKISEMWEPWVTQLASMWLFYCDMPRTVIKLNFLKQSVERIEANQSVPLFRLYFKLHRVGIHNHTQLLKEGSVKKVGWVFSFQSVSNHEVLPLSLAKNL